MRRLCQTCKRDLYTIWLQLWQIKSFFQPKMWAWSLYSTHTHRLWCSNSPFASLTLISLPFISLIKFSLIQCLSWNFLPSCYPKSLVRPNVSTDKQIPGTGYTLWYLNAKRWTITRSSANTIDVYYKFHCHSSRLWLRHIYENRKLFVCNNLQW